MSLPYPYLGFLKFSVSRRVVSPWSYPCLCFLANGYRKQTKRLGEHTDVYLYGEQSEDHYFGLNLMTKLMLGLRLKGFGVESIPK